MLDNGFLYETPPVAAAENGWIISKNFQTWECTEEFIKVEDL